MIVQEAIPPSASPPRTRASAFYRGIFFTGSGTTVNLVFLLLETLVVVRLLAPASYGIYVLLIVIANFGTVAIDFGCKTSVTQMIAGAARDRQIAVANSALAFRLGSAIILSIIVWLGRDLLLLLTSSREVGQLIVYVPLLIASASFDELLTAVLQGFQAFRQMAIAQISRSVLRLVLSVLFVLVLQLGIIGLLYSWILSFAVSIAYQYIVLPIPKRLVLDRAALAQVLRFGLPVQGTRLLWFAFSRVNVLLIGALAGTASVAFYAVASRIPEALQRFSESYISVYFPTVSNYLNAGKRREGAAVFRYSLRLISFAAALVALVSVLFSREIVVLLFSSTYEASTPAFALLMVALHMTLVTNVMSYTLTSAGYSGRSLAQDLVRTVLTVIGDLILIPVLGFVGPPLATMGAAYSTNPITVWLLRRSNVPVAVAPYAKQTALLVIFSGLFWLVHPEGIIIRVALIALFIAISWLLSTITVYDLSLVLPKGLFRESDFGIGAYEMTNSIVDVKQPSIYEKFRYQTAAALLVTALAAALRLYRVGANSFNLDEVWSIWMAGQSPGDLLRAILFQHWDSTPPTFYLFLQFFMQFGQQPFFVRALSVLAGTATVWITFQLASSLFGGRVGILSAFLVAIAPLHIEFSQVARAYVLADLWALCSLYFCARILFFEKPTRWHWIGLVAASAFALYTFYVTFLVVLVENCLVLALFLTRRVDRSVLRAWLLSQVVLAVAVLATALSAFQSISVVESGLGLTWIPRPGIQAIIKSAILFTTGNPSFGPIGVTLPRILSLGLVAALVLLVVLVFVRRGGHRLANPESFKVLFLAAAVCVPWMVTFVGSQVRPVYTDKYLLFILPPLLILFAWAILRSPFRLPAAIALVALVGLTGKSLSVYYSAPVGEQWREAVGYMRPAFQSSDVVIIAPGYYMRPYAYYFYGAFPADTRTVARSPAVIVQGTHFLPMKTSDEAEQALTAATADGKRVWYVSGFTAPDATLGTWIDTNFKPLNTGDYLGAHVQLLQPVRPLQTVSKGAADGG